TSSTVPENGAGISVLALSVSTVRTVSPSATVSPALTCTSRISASCRPSPGSANVNSLLMPSSSVVEHATGGVDDTPRVGQIILLAGEKRHRDVIPGNAPHRRLQIPERLFHQARRDFA